MRDLGTVAGLYNVGSWDQRRWAGGGLLLHGWSRRVHAFMTGPNGMGMRELGTLGGNDSSLLASMTQGRWWVLLAAGGGRHAFITGPGGRA